MVTKALSNAMIIVEHSNFGNVPEVLNRIYYTIIIKSQQ
jgi:hypothetical protein